MKGTEMGLCFHHFYISPTDSQEKEVRVTRGEFFKRIFAPTGKVGAYASVGFGSVCA
jgi:hypothetical protein